MALRIGIGTNMRIQGAFSWAQYWASRTPSDLVLTVISDTENKLDWTVNGTGYDNIIVERSDDGGAYYEIASLSDTTITYSDTTALVGILYYYRLRTYKSSNPSGHQYSPYCTAVNNLTGDISTGLVGRWLLNEGIGATAIDTGGTNNGIIVSADWVLGKIGYGLSFNGVSTEDSVKFGDILDTTFSGANKQFTISVYIKPNVNNLTGGFIIAKFMDGAENQRQLALHFSTDSKLRFTWYGALNSDSLRGLLGSTPITNIDKWYHILVTYDGTNATVNSRVKIFVDGIEETITVAVSGGTPSYIPNGTAQLSLGGATTTDGTASKYNVNCCIDSFNIFNRILTYNDILSLKYANYLEPSNTVRIFNYSAGQDDIFIDTLYKGSIIGNINFFINRPNKYYDNPIFEKAGVSAATWDYQKGFQSVKKISGVYKMWYNGRGVSDIGDEFCCYATSSDGITWTRPNLGMVSYDGNTNNNIILGKTTWGCSVLYDESQTADKRYIMVGSNRVGEAAGGLHIYKSADGITFNFIQELNLAGAVYSEGYDIIKRPDGKYIAYYNRDHATNMRAMGAWVSDSADIESTWTDQGIIIPTTITTSQKYGIKTFLLDGVYYGFVGNYNSTSGKIYLDFYSSRNGLAWTLKKSSWITLGKATTWEDEILIAGKDVIKIDNEWRFYYNGIDEGHSDSFPWDSRIGIATIGYKRIANIEGIGNFITTAFTPTDKLYINADLTHGTLQVELLLAADDSVISGYSQNDMDTLGAVDTYSKEVTWGGNSIPTDTSLKIKFYLT